MSGKNELSDLDKEFCRRYNITQKDYIDRGMNLEWGEAERGAESDTQTIKDFSDDARSVALFVVRSFERRRLLDISEFLVLKRAERILGLKGKTSR